MEHENINAPIVSYIDKRIWKTALLLRECFKESHEGLEEVLKGYEKNNEKNHRGKILVYMLLHNLYPKYHKSLKLFEEYKKEALEMI